MKIFAELWKDPKRRLYFFGGIAVVTLLLVWLLVTGKFDSFFAENGGAAYFSAAAQNPPEEGAAVGGSSKLGVHVVGLVNAPGFYELEAGDRVIDAIEAAGGFAEGADETSVNLAQILKDEQQVRVYAKPIKTPQSGEPRKGEPQEEGSRNGEPAAGEGALLPPAETDSHFTNGRLNINKADKSELTALPGIGEIIAGYIIDYRDKIGAFTAVDELKNVQKIGNKVFDGIKDSITVE